MESESEVTKLQLERAQLLAKITEIGTDLERRVREAVAAHASSAEAELILEKESRRSVESSLSDAISELNEARSRLLGETDAKKNKFSNEDVFHELNESLDDMRMANKDLQEQNKSLQLKIDESDKENNALIHNLKDKLHRAESRLRSEERASRFDVALASEIANLRAGGTSLNASQGQSQALVLQEMNKKTDPKLSHFEEGKDSMDHNSIYIIEMYDYVVELKNSINEERHMYRELLAEHEDLLALLGQAGLDGTHYGVSE